MHQFQRFGCAISFGLEGPFSHFTFQTGFTHWYRFKCGIPFQARSILADPNRVRDALLSLNHSKSTLCGSDFNLGQAHKHLTKYIYNEGIQAFSNDLQNRYSEYKCFFKISKLKKKTKHGMNAHVGAYSEISFFMTRRSSILGLLSIAIYHSISAHW